MATTPPGWYDDGHGAQRWWDGEQWTDRAQTPDAEPFAAEDATAPEAPAPEAPAPAGEPDLASGAPEPLEASSPPGETSLESVPDPVEAPAETMDADGETPAEAVAAASGTDTALTEPSPQPATVDATAPAVAYAPAAPQGYPGGFPGGPDPSGGFIAATEPKKSKLWILWVVLGVVLLGVVILAAVLIPILIGMFGSIANGGANGDGEAAAVTAVELYDEAWNTTDCDKFVEATTESFREVLQLADCASFTAASQGFIDSVEDYQITVTSVESAEDQVTVITSETYTSMVDAEGNPSDVPVPFEDNYAYIVVPSGDGWAINEALDANE